MAEKTMIPKALVKELKKTKHSRFTTRRIRIAIEDIHASTIDALRKSSRVTKMKLPAEDNIYIYRAGIRDRVIFSIKGADKIIRDVITADDLLKMKKGLTLLQSLSITATVDKLK